MRWLALAVSTLLAACAAQLPPAGHPMPQSEASAASVPRLSALPEVAQARSSERVQLGMSMARQLLAHELPAPPSDHRYARLQAWIDRVVTPWVAARRDGVDEARFEFGLGRGASSTERVIAQAVIGILHEDTALALTHIPAPTELDDEPEIARMFREIVRTQSQPFRTAALNDYRACADAGYAEGGELRPFARFCHARFDRLHTALGLRTASR